MRGQLPTMPGQQDHMSLTVNKFNTCNTNHNVLIQQYIHKNEHGAGQVCVGAKTQWFSFQR